MKLVRLLEPQAPPYDPLAWEKLPFAERARAVCAAWAADGFGAPPAVFALYGFKIAAFVAGWLFFCAHDPTLGPLSDFAHWWSAPTAFLKAIVWSLTFEVVGLGCGSGPLTGRYVPPFGGALYFLRPGTTKAPLFRGLPLLGGTRRTWLDAALYAALLGGLFAALLSPGRPPALCLAVVVVMAFAGIADKTVFLAARGEHYWTTLLCLGLAPNTAGFLAGAKAVQLALWFWAGVSKLNPHFRYTVGVMMSSGPLIPRWLRLRLYRRFPDDLEPSKLARLFGAFGTALELGTPIAFLFTPLGHLPVVAIALMLSLHGFIVSQVPTGVPLEWNFTVVYGGLALFAGHADVPLTAMGGVLGAVLLVLLGIIPLIGHLAPRLVSFLLAMRYYAGNWGYSVWLFKEGAQHKLEALTKSSGWPLDQLAHFYDRGTSVGLLGKVMGFRLMHLHGRAMGALLPRLIEGELAAYHWLDGELVAGMVLGWNFGDLHLHDERLLAAVQGQCAFAPGELRCAFVEAQPLGGNALHYRLADAATGPLEEGSLPVAALCARQPWG